MPNRIATDIIDNFIPIGGHCYYQLDPNDESSKVMMICRAHTDDVVDTCAQCILRSDPIYDSEGKYICKHVKCTSGERGDDFNVYFEPLQ